MPVLHLGVIDDLPYGQKGTVTTGDVAGWLEDKYHILEVYSQVHRQDMATAMEEGARGALESLLMGAPATIDVFAAGASKIEEGMKEFITNGEMDSLGYPGVPTQAARDLWGQTLGQFSFNIMPTAHGPSNLVLPGGGEWGLLSSYLNSTPYGCFNGVASFNKGGWLLKRDLDPVGNDNDPMWLEKAV